MVLIASSAPDEYKIALQVYTKHLGLVFQIQDDYLDQYASVSTLGKGRSSDRANQKTTFATLYSREQLKEKIDRHYQIALGSLTLFDEKALPLIELTKKLQKRTHLKNN